MSNSINEIFDKILDGCGIILLIIIALVVCCIVALFIAIFKGLYKLGETIIELNIFLLPLIVFAILALIIELKIKRISVSNKYHSLKNRQKFLISKILNKPYKQNSVNDKQGNIFFNLLFVLSPYVLIYFLLTLIYKELPFNITLLLRFYIPILLIVYSPIIIAIIKRIFFIGFRGNFKNILNSTKMSPSQISLKYSFRLMLNLVFFSVFLFLIYFTFYFIIFGNTIFELINPNLIIRPIIVLLLAFGIPFILSFIISIFTKGIRNNYKKIFTNISNFSPQNHIVSSAEKTYKIQNFAITEFIHSALNLTVLLVFVSFVFLLIYYVFTGNNIIDAEIIKSTVQSIALFISLIILAFTLPLLITVAKELIKYTIGIFFLAFLVGLVLLIIPTIVYLGLIATSINVLIASTIILFLILIVSLGFALFLLKLDIIIEILLGYFVFMFAIAMINLLISIYLILILLGIGMLAADIILLILLYVLGAYILIIAGLLIIYRKVLIGILALICFILYSIFFMFSLFFSVSFSIPDININKIRDKVSPTMKCQPKSPVDVKEPEETSPHPPIIYTGPPLPPPITGGEQFGDTIVLYYTFDTSNRDTYSDLSKKNFIIEEYDANSIDTVTIIDVVPISDNSTPTNVNVVLAIDRSGSMDNKDNRMELVKQASKVFVRQIDSLNQNSKISFKIALLPFSGNSISGINFIQFNKVDWSSDIEIINRKIQLIKPIENDSTPLWDAMYESLKLLSTIKGYNLVIAFTDGINNKSKYEPYDVIDLAEKLNVPIYTVAYGMDINTVELIKISEISHAGGKGIGSFINVKSDEISNIFMKFGWSIKNLHKVYWRSSKREQNDTILIRYKIIDDKENIISKGSVKLISE